jgi:hypothetical protein
VLATLAMAMSPWAGATASEVCRFEGTTSHAGRVAVRTEVATADGQTVVDVALSLRASVWWILDIQYLTEEVSTWRGGELRAVAVNNRTIADGRVVRQQWDVFTPGAGSLAGSLEGWRVQAKTLAEFRRKHPGFARHWTPASFGGAWLQDYAAARPERRPDLDLPRAAMPPGLRTPLAMAFYWTRWTPPGGQAVPVFLPGFKRDARVDLAVTPAGPLSGAWQLWRVPLRHPALGAGAPSEAEAWVSPDRHLLQLAFDLHARQGVARGVVRAAGCQGVP